MWMATSDLAPILGEWLMYVAKDDWGDIQRTLYNECRLRAWRHSLVMCIVAFVLPLGILWRAISRARVHQDATGPTDDSVNVITTLPALTTMELEAQPLSLAFALEFGLYTWCHGARVSWAGVWHWCVRYVACCWPSKNLANTTYWWWWQTTEVNCPADGRVD
jgi:hypothetical protein